jgi:HEAT repeat protein
MPWVRGSAVESLAQLGRVSKEVVNSLLNARNDDDFLVHRAALQSLKQIIQASDEVVSILLVTLCDSHADVRRTSAESLGLLGQGQTSKEVVTALLNTLCDHDFSVRRHAVESLGQLGPVSDKVVTALLKTLHDDSEPAVRVAAAKSFEKSPPTQEVQAKLTKALSRALHDDSLEVCYQAAIGLGKLRQGSSDIEAIDLWQQVLPDMEIMLFKALQSAESWPVRRDAALLLGQVGQSTSSTALLNGLRDKYSLVCTACAQALAELGKRYPKTAEIVENELAQVIEDPEIDRLNESFRDNAFNGLWLLVVGDEIEARR